MLQMAVVMRPFRISMAAAVTLLMPPVVRRVNPAVVDLPCKQFVTMDQSAKMKGCLVTTEI